MSSRHRLRIPFRTAQLFMKWQIDGLTDEESIRTRQIAICW